MLAIENYTTNPRNQWEGNYMVKLYYPETPLLYIRSFLD